MLQRARVYTHGTYNYYFGSLDGTMHNALRSTKAGGSRTAWTDACFVHKARTTDTVDTWIIRIHTMRIFTDGTYKCYREQYDVTMPYNARRYNAQYDLFRRAVQCYNAWYDVTMPDVTMPDTSGRMLRRGTML